MSTLSKRIILSSSYLLYIIVLIPLLSLLLIAIANFSYSQWPANTLSLLSNTILIALFSTLLAILIGTSCAWIVETCIFPGRKVLAFLLFIPFAIPPYLQAYIWGDIFEDLIRNPIGACMIMASVLYPYVYLFARANFANRSCNLITTSRVLGCTPVQAFFKVALPLAQPAIAIGAALVFMEVLNDIAIAQNFGLNTLGYQIYDLWLNRSSYETVFAITLLLVLISFALIFFEVIHRNRQKLYESIAKDFCNMNYYYLNKLKSYLVVGYCSFIVVIGFGLPLIYLIIATINNLDLNLNTYVLAIIDTLVLVLLVCIVCFILGFAIVKVKRNLQSKYLKAGSSFPTSGYALPGIIYALGFIVVVSFIANKLFDITGVSIHWLWISSPFILILALACRYCIVSTGSIEVGLNQVSPKFIAASRVLGSNYLSMLKNVYYPLMKTTLIVGGVLLATDIIKELPLTLILRPLGTDTLALLVYQFTSDEDLNKAAPYALTLVILTTGLLSFAYPRLVSFVNRPM